MRIYIQYIIMNSSKQNNEPENKMNEINKDILVSFGGKVWSKEDKELRVYLNADAILAMTKGFQVLENTIQAMNKAKTYFDIQKNVLVSDIGLVRSHLNGAGYKCCK